MVWPTLTTRFAGTNVKFLIATLTIDPVEVTAADELGVVDEVDELTELPQAAVSNPIPTRLNPILVFFMPASRSLSVSSRGIRCGLRSWINSVIF